MEKRLEKIKYFIYLIIYKWKRKSGELKIPQVERYEKMRKLAGYRQEGKKRDR